jgi:hypothetical protein
MLLQELKEQVYKLTVSDRLPLVSLIIESLQAIPSLQPDKSNAIGRMRGLLKTDQPAPTDEEVEAMLEERLVERYLH